MLSANKKEMQYFFNAVLENAVSFFRLLLEGCFFYLLITEILFC